ncbi:hypothetical protein SAMN05192549_103122 [Duganella sacchari]|uniref:Lipoprotein n=2 Tax=Telluria group TaxID=2895353 RepID=A0A1M7MD23_9BURK|nr:hypothetical protein [Duganella sp. CY15W]SHM88688.1 hypothetical protein SAMN05192549_103122 [Duganella sacchari]
MKRILALLGAVALTGCASIAGEKMQPISVTTVFDNKEVAGLGCTLTNDAGSWFLTSPGSVTVHKSTGNLAIDCKRDAYAGNATAESKSNGAVWGNILLGGGIGYIVDRNTGAGFDYPPTIVVALRQVDTAGIPANAPLKPAAGDSVPKAN